MVNINEFIKGFATSEKNLILVCKNSKLIKNNSIEISDRENISDFNNFRLYFYKSLKSPKTVNWYKNTGPINNPFDYNYFDNLMIGYTKIIRPSILNKMTGVLRIE